jgi:chromosome segregation ATPase
MNNEISLIKNENEQVVSQLTTQLTENKTNYQNEITKKNTQIDQMKIEINELKTQLTSVKENLVIGEKERDQEKKNLISDLTTISKQESELIKTLEEKYGSGNINSETGEISPIQQ